MPVAQMGELQPANSGSTSRGSPPLSSPSRRPTDWHDALVLAHASDGLHVIASPNMKLVPSPPVGIVQVSLRADYRYGLVDPIQWPQLYCEEYGYLAAILRPIHSPDNRYAPLWWTPKEKHFQRSEGQIVTHLGLLSPAALHPLLQLVDRLLLAATSKPDTGTHRHLLELCTYLRHARDRLLYFPCDFNDASMQVREVQRYWLMARSYMDFHTMMANPSSSSDSGNQCNTTFMGAFTTNPRTVQNLFALGIPVWFIRVNLIPKTSHVRAVVGLTPPSKICTDYSSGGGTILYSGLSGSRHIPFTFRGGHTYRDIARAPQFAFNVDNGPTSPASQKGYKGMMSAPEAVLDGTKVVDNHPSSSAPSVHRTQKSSSRRHNGKPYSKAHPSQGYGATGVNKFIDFKHEWMPQGIPTWLHAMTSVEVSKPGARPSTEIWGYWIPEPALLLRPDSVNRRDRYIMTWLRMRNAWLYVLRLSDARPTSVPTQWWRDVLYGPTDKDKSEKDTQNSVRWKAILLVLGDIFPEANLDVAPEGPVRWFDRLVSQPDATIAPQIIWEMHDLAFRYELQALDRLLVPIYRGPRGEQEGGPVRGEQERDELLGRIFPSNHLHALTALPDPEHSLGLCDPSPERRVPALEALRQVLSRWQRCPDEIRRNVPITTSMTADEIISLEKSMATFYVHTFFKQSGRAPIVPHQFPVPRR
ncbi:hypothetical protein C8Q80DRAFT_231036 [Daedaleopsis nitida]|nr:hypothetical protein C8Q80DRAFT_231036 [Daedaleopsis nitida]